MSSDLTGACCRFNETCGASRVSRLRHGWSRDPFSVKLDSLPADLGGRHGCHGCFVNHRVCGRVRTLTPTLVEDALITRDTRDTPVFRTRNGRERACKRELGVTGVRCASRDTRDGGWSE
jgi:hypothetical protein